MRHEKRRGQGLSEVSLVVALIAIVAILILSLLGGKVGGLFECVVKDIRSQSCTANDVATSDGFMPGGNYASTVQSDHPVAYWKLDDSTATIADASGNGHTGTLAGPGTATEGIAGALLGPDKAILFDGSTNSINTNPPIAALGSNWTLEGWVKTNTSATMHIVETSPMEFYITAGGNLTADKVPGVGTVTTSGVALADGNWHYVVATDDGTNLTLYVDGQFRVSSPNLGAGAAITGTTVAIAQAVAGGGYFNGGLDDVAVYNVALSLSQVQAHFAAASV